MSDNAGTPPDSAPEDGDAYDAASISVLKGLDAGRRRPGMYIGDTDDGSGLHHMAFEIIDNAVDEVQAGFASRVELTLNGDGGVPAVVNALSEWMEVRIWRLGQEHRIRFQHGDADGPLEIVGQSDRGSG